MRALLRSLTTPTAGHQSSVPIRTNYSELLQDVDHASRGTTAKGEGSDRWQTEHRGDRRAAEYSAMAGAFAAHDGMVPAEEMVRLMRRGSSQPLSCLARWIVGRTIVIVLWKSQILVPIFQLLMEPSIHVQRVIAELGNVFDDWELAYWFAQPSCWLDGGLPVDRLRSNPEAVLQAARTDRFIARG